MRQITATEKFRAVNEGLMAEAEFVRQMRQLYPMHVSQYNGFNDTVQILKNKGLLFEAKEEEDQLNSVSDEAIRRGIDAELEGMGLDSAGYITSEDRLKARGKAIANLKKDPLHYLNLVAGESSKVDKHDKSVEYKKGKEVDTFNGLKKAALKEHKSFLTEGTRALVGFLSGDRLTTTYNHYDGYPSNLGKGLEAHYNSDELAKDVAMKGYITYLDPETGDIEATHNDPPGKVLLPDDPEARAMEIGQEIDRFGADFGYIWDDNSNQWITIKNTGIRSMKDQILDKLDMVNIHSGEDMNNENDIAVPEQKTLREQTIDLIAYLKKEKGAGNEVIKDFIKTHFNDIKGMSLDQIGDEFDEFLSVNYELPGDYNDLGEGDPMTMAYTKKVKVSEKKGKDHDGDGDIDGDDYMAAKDKAIKKAMGKDVDETAVNEYRGVQDDVIEIIKDMAMNADGDEIEAAMELMEFIGEHYKIDFEFGRLGGGNYGRNDGAPYEGKSSDDVVKENVKAIIQKVLEEQVISEAATANLADWGEGYAGFDGVKSVVNDLENIVTEIESFYDKIADKIANAFEKTKDFRNLDGMQVGAFIAPSLEAAFKKDLRPVTKTGFFNKIELPKVRTISQADVDAHNSGERPLGEDEKQTVFAPLRENKKK